MLKVLHILPMNKLSGAERMGLLICKHMTDVKSYVITGGANLASVFEKEGIQASHVNISIKQLPKVMKKLNQYIKEKQIDIIHAHDNIASLCAYLTKKRYRLNVKVVSHIHSCYPWLEGNGIYKQIDRWARPKYDYSIACGQMVYDYYEQHASYLNKNKMGILSNAIDINTLMKGTPQKLEKIKNDFNIPSNKIIIGYIGRLIELKGLIPFIKTLVKYKQHFSKCKFLIVGDGDQELEIKNLVKELELEEIFIFTGFQSDVYLFYQLIDIFFLPSLYEGLPMVILEAMGVGIPVVTMNVGGIPEVVNNQNGRLINSNDLNSFMDSLIELKNNESTRKLIGESAKKSIIENYDMGVYNSKLFNIYRQLTE